MENDRNTQAQQQSEVPQIPPLRRYIIERYNPANDALEPTPVQAHFVQHLMTADVVQFVEFVYDPTVQMIRERIVLCVSAFESYWEDYTPPSNLVMPSNGNRH